MSDQNNRKTICKNMKKTRSNASKYRKLKKQTDIFYKKLNNFPDEIKIHQNMKAHSSAIEEEKEEIIREENRNCSNNSNFKEYLQTFFDYDPLQSKFFSKKKFSNTIRQVDPKEIYEKTSQISKKLIEQNYDLPQINFMDYFDTCLMNPSANCRLIYNDLFLLNLYKNILNDADFLNNEANLLQNKIEFSGNFAINSIKENIIDVKTHFLRKMNVLTILLITMDSNETRLLVYVRALDLNTFKTSQAVLVKGPIMPNVMLSSQYKDAFLTCSDEKEEANLNLLIIVRDKMTIFELKVEKIVNLNEVVLTSLIFRSELQIPNIEKCCVFSTDCLVFKHVCLKKLYKFSMKNKAFLKKDMGSYSLSLFDSIFDNNLIVCYTESQKILLLDENLQIIFNEVFTKIEKWRIFNTHKNYFEMIVIRTGYNHNEKFLFLLSFYYNKESGNWGLVYTRIKNHNTEEFIFSTNINLFFYKRDSYNILFLKENLAMSYDCDEDKMEYVYYPSKGKENIYKEKEEAFSENGNIYLIFSNREFWNFNLILEIQNDSLRIFSLSLKIQKITLK